jgi:hypothetical protein
MENKRRMSEEGMGQLMKDDKMLRKSKNLNFATLKVWKTLYNGSINAKWAQTPVGTI